MPDIKLFVCCHQKCAVPDHPLLIPMQVGAALSKNYFNGFVTDDTGDNISPRNREYCELTAQYWAWKNCNADYIGFFHYRRYLYPDSTARRPYIIKNRLNLSVLQQLQYESFPETIQQYDMILPRGENMFMPVRKQYASAKFHHRRDLQIIEDIIREKSPDYISAMEEYLNGTICYFGNIYIMRKAVFQNYCTWLFGILSEFDRRADISKYSAQERRADGYLAERLLGIYVTLQRDQLKVLELPRVHFLTKQAYARGVLVNTMLPPGTRRRSLIKNVIRQRDRHEYQIKGSSVS